MSWARISVVISKRDGWAGLACMEIKEALCLGGLALLWFLVFSFGLSLKQRKEFRLLGISLSFLGSPVSEKETCLSPFSFVEWDVSFSRPKGSMLTILAVAMLLGQRWDSGVSWVSLFYYYHGFEARLF